MRTRTTTLRRHRACRVLITAIAIASTVVLSACIGRLFHKGNDVDRLRFGPGKLTLYQLQSSVRDVADETTDLIADATQRTIEAGVSPEGRRLADQIRLEFGLNATINASAPNPLIALIDLAVMTRLSANAMQDHPPPELGVHAHILMTAMQDAEVRVWSLAAKALKPKELAEVTEAIEKWKVVANTWPYITSVRLSDFAEMRLVAPGGKRPDGLGSSLLDILSVDPLAGLDPATREIEQSRMLAERAMFQLQRAPRLLRWEVESLYDTLASSPEMESTFAAIDRVSVSSEKLVGTIGGLPRSLREEQSVFVGELHQALDAERAATAKSISELIAHEREALRGDLESVQAPLGSSLGQVRQTAESLSTLTVQLNELVKSSDALATRLRLGEGESKPSSGSDQDFKETAAELASTARDLRGTLDTVSAILDKGALEKGSDGARVLIADADASATKLANLLFWRGMALIGIFGAVLFLALGAARMIPRARA